MCEFLSSGGKTTTFCHGDPVDEVFSVVPSAEARLFFMECLAQ